MTARTKKGINDFETWCKSNNRLELLEEWDFDKNVDIIPSEISRGNSHQYIWWICPKGHSYQAYVYNRVTVKAGCPYCSNHKILIGYNDLTTTHPEIAAQWDHEKNKELKPTMLTAGSSQKVWWRCLDCDNSWSTTVAARTEGSDCPKCAIIKRSSKSRVKKGINDFETWCKESNRIDLLKEWDNDKNGLNPDEVAFGSHKIYGWVCSKCHNSFESNIPNRRFGNNCPYCSNQKVKEGFNDFETYCKQNNLEFLLNEWDYVKNTKKPSEIPHGTGKKYWWICEKCNNFYDSTISHRLVGRSCPYCKGTGRKKVMKGLNDFQSYCESHGGEYLLDEWDYDANGFGPDEITVTSTKVIVWKCKRCGKNFKLLTAKRLRGDGCPDCNYYRKTSFREQVLYFYTKLIFPDAQNRYIFEGVELDIYIPSLKLGIEYDGQYWHQDLKRDLAKTKAIKETNIKLLRIREPNCVKFPDDEKSNIYVLNSISEREYERVLKEIFARIGKKEVDIDLERDRLTICKTYLNTAYEQSLEYRFPDMAKEWLTEKNKGLDPSRVSVASTIKARWLCSKCGNEYNKRVFERTIKNSGCQYCSNRAVKIGFNDLATTRPEVAAQWNYKRNGDLKPTHVTFGCSKKVWWICEAGHEWETYIYSRSKGIGCPYCSNHRILVGYNDLATTHPEIAAQWNYERNDELKPTMVTARTNKKIWWNSKNCGHCFIQQIGTRIKGGKCPICSGRQ